jgi:FMN reductase
MTARRIAVVTAGLSQPSSTRLLSDRLAQAVVRRLAEQGIDASVDIHELRDTAQDVTNNLLTGFANPKLEKVIESVTTADGVIAVTPIFTTSYSGLFKSFIDILDPQSMADMPVLIGATGGSERHSLALDYAIRPLFSYLHAATVPTAVYAASSDWGHGADAATTALPERIERAAGELAALVAVSDRSSQVRDPFALPAGFSPVGAYGAQ